jgi:hypothetical protein
VAAVRIWENGYVINQIVIRATREITNAMIAAHLGDERNDQRDQTKANTAKMMRSHPRCSRTRQTPSGGLGVATAILNMICQCTIPERTSISNVAAKKAGWHKHKTKTGTQSSNYKRGYQHRSVHPFSW